LTGLRSNMALLSDRLTINCLGDGTAIMVVLTYTVYKNQFLPHRKHSPCQYEDQSVHAEQVDKRHLLRESYEVH
jgi:hypothetical protein